MNAGVMEGLVGASSNMKIVEVPMHVYHEAEREGNTAKMERALGYAADFTKRAYTYKEEAEEELKLEMEEKRETEEIEQEEAIEKAREEGKANQEALLEGNMDSVEISEEGRLLLEQSIQEKTPALPESAETIVKAGSAPERPGAEMFLGTAGN
ncbi:hypothetical protein D7V86_17520 [bacterium D16-51]|nr:hypothetical protein D7V96_17645 [bacterium D16-59]RKI57449.1 hypothetical protein D7V86_17520 [bacterium D16-51]